MGGGVLYNKKIYADLGLKIPMTWKEFMDNNAKIKAKGGIAPVIQSFKDTWTSQLFVLGDFYNVLTAVPTFPADYTANKATFATTPAALRGFQHQEDVFNAGYLNSDFASATFDDALKMLASGKGAHYPMLSFAISNIRDKNPGQLTDVGFFALPGDDASKNGLTTWMLAGIYVAKTTPHPDDAKKVRELHRLEGRLRRPDQGDRRDRPLFREGLRPARRRRARRRRPRELFQEGRRHGARARIPVADQGAFA